MLLLGRFTVNKVNFFLDVENNSKNVEKNFTVVGSVFMKL